MAKKSMINRDIKRSKLVAKHWVRRSELKKIIKSPKSSSEQRLEAIIKLQTLPRDTSSIRQRSRCFLTGRSHGFYRKFGLAKTKLRERTMNCEVPGLSKASW